MSRILLCSIAILLLVDLIQVSAQQTADTVYTNGQVYTVDEKRPWAEAVAIKDGKFVAVGSNDEIVGLKGEETEVIDLDGAFVMPGLFDTHIHPDMDADNRTNISFPVTADWATIEKTLKDFREKNPDRQWLHGGVLNWLKDGGENIEGLDVPSHKRALDAIVSDRGIALWDQGAHAMLCNSKALELAGITRDTKPPEGGIIVCDENGEPNGVLRESATNLIFAVMDIPRGENWKTQGLKPFLDQMSSYGVTGICDAYGFEYTMVAYRALEMDGNLHHRVQVMIGSPLDKSDDQARDTQERLLGPSRASFTTNLINADGIKYILDGSAAGKTAVMLKPFIGTDFRGNYRNDIQAVQKDILQRDQQGIAVKAHAIGDRAVREALDGFEAARNANPNGPRHSIGHGTLIHADDIPRFAKLNVIFEASPALWFPNSGAKLIEKDIGPEKTQTVWPLKQLMESGAIVTYGSDWTVSFTPNPWVAVETMITRQKPGGSEDALGAQNAIDLESALKILTINGAIHLNVEEETGSISVGKSADMIVLDRNLFEVEVTTLHQTQVKRTLFKGKTVFESR